MYLQFSEGLPGLVVNQSAKTVYIDQQEALSDIEIVYERYLARDLDFFKISQDHARGFYAFLEHLKNVPPSVRFVKGHITGPISYALFLTDENRRSVIYNKDIFEVLTKTLVMKARWQIKLLKNIFPNVIIFIDEPYLVSIGSSFVNINMEEALIRLTEVVDAIREEGALSGIHCCGNTDWSMLFSIGIDILNFDAYNFIKEFSLYSQQIDSFLSRNATIALGIVPSSDSVRKETADSLIEKARAAVKAISGRLQSSGQDGSFLITPSCGVGGLDESLALDVMKATRRLSESLKKV